jgi:hypothetical protein
VAKEVLSIQQLSLEAAGAWRPNKDDVEQSVADLGAFYV